ncbi:helix-turn-helix transcriptional regulator [Enterobacter sp. RHBSTW-00994]|uniref:AraC family transcriptional regulator n=1 Tax=Enterobacter sp. RHBSTW-00994 TaxID=2742676 RepID=UPI0015E90781|nr:helix-turn-helix transcriptional regulator [Enterobacter sp. RHBSTW-00994]QLR43927.1 helix-turn-helix transcriptional regulator [Enterobacter sp. RHBSTW-00994]
MPTIIDRTPIHDDAIGWSRGAINYARGEVDPPHHHAQGQLLFATKGVMLVETDRQRWVIPPQRALWIPPFQEHTYSVLSETALRAIWFSPSLIALCEPFTRKEEVHVIMATPLFKELIGGLFSAGYSQASQRTMAVLLLEILSETQHISAELPMPVDERLQRTAREIIANNLWDMPMEILAERAAMSERTFSRLFIKDTGFSFRAWRQRARICASLDLLANGIPVKQVAWMLGFSGQSSFAAAFRSILNATPGEFLPEQKGFPAV